MPITREQAQPGVMVNIPTQKTAGHSDLEKSLARAGGSGKFLFIVTAPDVDGCVGLWGSYPTPEGEWYSIKDLTLYGEQANPIPYPLPEEGFEGNTEDPINPTHYKGKEVFNQMVDLFGVEEVKVFCRLNAYKYLSRAGKKEGNPIDQDVAKALWYLKEYDNLNSLPNGQ